MTHVAHVVGEEAHHEVFNLLLVFVIHGMNIHVKGNELRCSTWLAVLFHHFQIAIDHGEELQWIEFFALVFDFYMEGVGTDSDDLPCLYLFAVVGKHVAQVGIGHFIVTVSGNLVDAVNGIVAQSCHLAGSYCR